MGGTAEQLVHRARLVAPTGGVSPYCAPPTKPYALDLQRESWTLDWSAVTCVPCLAKRPRAEHDASAQ